jgi:hypothetical protein
MLGRDSSDDILVQNEQQLNFKPSLPHVQTQ